MLKLEKYHTILLGFFALIYFLGGLYFREVQTFIGLPSAVWIICGLLYFLGTATYYATQGTLPYLDSRRFLAFLDLILIFLLLYLTKGHPLFWLLMSIHIVVLMISLQFSNTFSMNFFFGYLALLTLICFINAYCAYETLPATLFVGFSTLFGQGMLILSILAGSSELVKEKLQQQSFRLENLRQQKLESYSQANKKVKNERKKTQYHSNKKQQKLKTQLDYRDAIYGAYREFGIHFDDKKDLESYSSYEELFSQIKKIIIENKAKKDLTKEHGSKLELAEEINHCFKTCQSMFEKASEAQMQLHFMEPVPRHMHIGIVPIFSWVLYQWFGYFFRQGSYELKILISHHNNQLHFKAIGYLPIEDTGHEPKGFTCPGCDKKVRALYRYQDEIVCSQCLRAFIEKQLKEHWEAVDEFPAEYSKTFEYSLWLSKRLLEDYDLGSVKYSIHSWENREYSITLVINEG